MLNFNKLSIFSFPENCGSEIFGIYVTEELLVYLLMLERSLIYFVVLLFI